MNETTQLVGPDAPTRHVLVTAAEFTGQLQSGFAVKVAKGAVLAVESLGQTNIFHGGGPRHPKGTLIEHATAKPGDVLPDDEVEAGVAAAVQKQAAVPGQIAAREAQRKAAIAADPPLTAEEKRALRALIAGKPAG